MNPALFTIVLSSMLVTAAKSSIISLNDDQNCMGRTIATLNLSVADECQTIGVGQAHGASMVFDSKEEESGANRDTLLFYNTPDCSTEHGDIIASTDGLCVSIDGLSITGRTPYQSFRIVSPEISQAGERMGWKENNAALLRHGLMWDDLGNQPTSDDGNFHGQIFVTGGDVYRSHQIHMGAWVGVPIDEWDEEVNVRNDEPMVGMAWDERVGGHMGVDEGEL